ncbi:MAG: chromosomal replication initiator protein DnaA [Sideroxydans sp.]|nr:chromosomal replication initiator protein DnaA [Sideroxydans sp.]
MQEQKLWRACLACFENQLSPQQFNTWIKPLHLSQEQGSLILSAPNSFILKQVQARFLSEIHKIASELYNPVPEITFRVNDAEPETARVSPPIAMPAVLAKAKPESSYRSYSKLNSSLSFENFVIGKANQLAFAAAEQVAHTPGTSYNPMFIYGGVGLGKTHLAQAIANQIKINKPDAKICYMHAERYVSDVVKAYQTNKFEEFKQYYHSLDVLLIDDIQFFVGKNKTQEEFFYAFNILIDSHKQVILTSDTFPKEITGLDTRLISRLGWGLTVAIEPPELEMRVAILLKKAELNGYVLESSVAFFIAKHINSNVRELEGALKRVEAFARFHKRDLSIETAKEALKDIIVAQNRQVSIENIQKTVAEYFHIKVNDLLSKKRTRNIARPRQIAMSLTRQLTSLSLPEIGLSFGGRDHSTVIHACKTIETLKNADSVLHADFQIILQTLQR